MQTFVLDKTQDSQVIDLTNQELKKVTQKIAVYALCFMVLAILTYFMNATAIVLLVAALLAARYIYKGVVGIQQMDLELDNDLINEASIEAFQNYYQRR